MSLRHSAIVALGLVALVGLAHAAAPAPPREEIVGVWRGNSTCIKAAWNAACNDEKVVYRVRVADKTPGAVTFDAYKIVGGRETPMYALDFTYRPDTRTWNAQYESRNRGRILLSYRVRGRTMTGTLVQLPSRRLARRVAVVRD